jgi:hypothetical protein
MRGVSGGGGGGPGNTWRQIAAPKQKATRGSHLPGASWHPHRGPARRGRFGPSRLGALGGEHRAVGGQLRPAIGAVLNWVWCRHRTTILPLWS